MPNIFGSCAGKIAVVASDDCSLVPLAGVIVGDFKDHVRTKAILTGFSISGSGGIQVMHTLRNFIYIYTFGERAGEASITGITIPGSCVDTSADTGDFRTGLTVLHGWYQMRRVTTQGSPVLITFGPDMIIQGFLTSFKSELTDASMGIGQFALSFVYPPPTTLSATQQGPASLVTSTFSFNGL